MKKRRKRKKRRISNPQLATRRKVKLSSTKGKKNQDVEFEGDDDVELTTEEQAEYDSAVNALSIFAQTNFESLRNTPSDTTTVLLSFQTSYSKTIRRSRTKNLQFLFSC